MTDGEIVRKHMAEAARAKRELKAALKRIEEVAKDRDTCAEAYRRELEVNGKLRRVAEEAERTWDALAGAGIMRQHLEDALKRAGYLKPPPLPKRKK